MWPSNSAGSFLQGGSGSFIQNAAPARYIQPAAPIPVYRPAPAPYRTPVYQPAARGYTQGYNAPSSSYAVPPPPPIPRPDISGLQAQARQAAEGAVNPYYTKLLNDFLGEQVVKRTTQQQDYEMTVKQLEEANALKQKNLEESSKFKQKTLEEVLGMNLRLYEQALSQTLKENELTKGRTIEDVGTEKANINQAADVFQTQTGTEGNAQRIALARETAARGLTGGLGAQAQEAQTTQRNTAEKLQEEQFTQARVEKDLFQNRTLDDLMKSGELAKTTKAFKEEGARLDTAQGKAAAALEETQGKAAGTLATAQGKERAKFDLDSIIKNYDAIEYAKKNQLRQEQLDKVALEERKQRELTFNNWLTTLSNPAQIAEARGTYGGFF